MSKSAAAFRTISEVAEELDVPKHVLRFWELKFSQLKPMKRGGGRRYYRPEDLEMLRGIRHLLYADGYTIKGVQKILRERGVQTVKAAVTTKQARAVVSDSAGRAGEKLGSGSTARGKNSGGSVGKGSAKGSGKRASLDKSFDGALSTKRVKAVERVIKELEVCREILHVAPCAPKTRVSRAKPRSARAAR